MAIYQRTSDFVVRPSSRGHHVVYRAKGSNFCPGCGRSHWHVGRMSAECGFCGTAVALAETNWSPATSSVQSPVDSFPEAAAPADEGDERREHERIDVQGRRLQLLIEGAPISFALRNISAGGLMGSELEALRPNTPLHVRFEGGILVPAVVRWTEGNLSGLAFTSPILLDLGGTQ